MFKVNNKDTRTTFGDKVYYNTTPPNTWLALGPNTEAPCDLRVKILLT